MSTGAHVMVSIVATPIKESRTPPSRMIGQMFNMDDSAVQVHFTPKIARQWIEALTPIAAQEVK